MRAVGLINITAKKYQTRWHVWKWSIVHGSIGQERQQKMPQLEPKRTTEVSFQVYTSPALATSNSEELQEIPSVSMTISPRELPLFTRRTHAKCPFRARAEGRHARFLLVSTSKKRLLISQALLNLKTQQQQRNKQETWSTNTTPLSRSPGMLIFAVEPWTEPGIFVRYRRNP